jgi:hypothetical protein
MGDFHFAVLHRLLFLMKKLIFHAGLPKTGSSALQVFLARNQNALRRQSIDYFRLGEFDRGHAGLISSGNGYFVARSLLYDGNPDAADTPQAHLAAVRAAIAASDCDTGLLSSEIFADCDTGRLQKFVEDLRRDGVTAKFIFFVRAQDQLICSLYIQVVKRQQLRDGPEAFARHVYPRSPYLKYANFYKTHRAIFGPDNVTVCSYEQAMAGNGGLCQSFLNAIGATATGLAFNDNDVNLALSPGQLAIMRELNKFRPHMRIADHLVENNSTAGITQRGETHHILAPDLSHEIKAYFAAENAELAALCFGGENPFPDLPISGAPIADLEAISPQEIIDVLGGLLVRYDERLAHLESELERAANSPWKRLVRKLARASRRAGPDPAQIRDEMPN